MKVHIKMMSYTSEKNPAGVGNTKMLASKTVTKYNRK